LRAVGAREIAEVDMIALGVAAFIAGPVAEFELRGPFDDFVFALDGAVRVEELIGDVGHDGGAAWGDAALGDQDEEAGEKLVDREGDVKLGGLGRRSAERSSKSLGAGTRGRPAATLPSK
jgi:hypothetical protein